MVYFRRFFFWKVLTLFLLFSFFVQAEENASVQIEVSSTHTTPGQLIDITLTINYDDGVEMIFNPAQQQWGKIRLLEKRLSSPIWRDNQWLSQWHLKVIAPLAGQYEFPELLVHFYRDADHWQVSAPAIALEVTSAFSDNNLKLQKIEPLPIQEDNSLPLGVLAIVAGLVLILLGLWLKRRKVGETRDARFTSAEDLAEQAEKSGYMDWEALRQWLIIRSGSDPLGKLTATEPLLHRYQQLRFDQSSNLPLFIKLCRKCQERWQ